VKIKKGSVKSRTTRVGEKKGTQVYQLGGLMQREVCVRDYALFILPVRGENPCDSGKKSKIFAFCSGYAKWGKGKVFTRKKTWVRG